MLAALVIPPYPNETPPRKRFTRTEFQQMTDSGLFVDQRLELIDGDLIDKMGQKPLHAYVIRLVQALLSALFGSERIQVQLPIEVQSADQEWSLPEPDLAVLKEAKAEFQVRYPRGSDLLLVVEVADTTLAHDLTTKRDLYARGGVAEYWVLDVRTRRLIRHSRLTGNQYAAIKTWGEEEIANLEGARIPVANLFPKEL